MQINIILSLELNCERPRPPTHHPDLVSSPAAGLHRLRRPEDQPHKPPHNCAARGAVQYTPIHDATPPSDHAPTSVGRRAHTEFRTRIAYQIYTYLDSNTVVVCRITKRGAPKAPQNALFTSRSIRLFHFEHQEVLKLSVHPSLLSKPLQPAHSQNRPNTHKKNKHWITDINQICTYPETAIQCGGGGGIGWWWCGKRSRDTEAQATTKKSTQKHRNT